MKHMVSLGSAEWKSIVVEGARKLGIDVSGEQAEYFAVHARNMVHWNRKVNLTAITDPFDIAVKHYLDSIMAVPIIESGSSLLDVGSGAGFPGIPLNIMVPSLTTTLLEARRKRVSFLKQVIRSLKIVNVRVCHDRLEQMADLLPPEAGFDVIVSRAFSDLKLFAVHAFPLLNAGGCLVAYKGKKSPKTEAEIAEVAKTKMPGGSEVRLNIEMRQCVLPYLEIERTLIIMDDPGARSRDIRH